MYITRATLGMGRCYLPRSAFLADVYYGYCSVLRSTPLSMKSDGGLSTFADARHRTVFALITSDLVRFSPIVIGETRESQKNLRTRLSRLLIWIQYLPSLDTTDIFHNEVPHSFWTGAICRSMMLTAPDASDSAPDRGTAPIRPRVWTHTQLSVHTVLVPVTKLCL